MVCDEHEKTTKLRVHNYHAWPRMMDHDGSCSVMTWCGWSGLIMINRGSLCSIMIDHDHWSYIDSWYDRRSYTQWSWDQWSSDLPPTSPKRPVGIPDMERRQNRVIIIESYHISSKCTRPVWTDHVRAAPPLHSLPRGPLRRDRDQPPKHKNGWTVWLFAHIVCFYCLTRLSKSGAGLFGHIVFWKGLSQATATRGIPLSTTCGLDCRPTPWIFPPTWIAVLGHSHKEPDTGQQQATWLEMAVRVCVSLCESSLPMTVWWRVRTTVANGCFFFCVSQYEFVWVCVSLCKCVWVCVSLCEFGWVCVSLCEFVSAWVFVGLCESVWVYVSLCESVWVYVSLCESVWVLRTEDSVIASQDQRFECITAFVCESVWVCVSLCESWWVCVSLCWSVWVCVSLVCARVCVSLCESG